MSSKALRQLLVLAALVAVAWGAVTAFRDDTPTAPAAVPSNLARSNTTAAGPAAVADVKLDLLKTEEKALEPSTRNPFQFRQRAVAGGSASGRAAPPPPVFVPPPAPPPGPPPATPIALKYIGVLESAQGRVAIFRDNGGDIVNGKEGDIIDGRYRLLKIGVESADLSYIDGHGRQTIRLSGQ